MIQRLQKRGTSILEKYRELKELKKYLTDNHGLYTFLKNDLELYRLEKETKLLLKNSIEADNILNTVTIGNHTIFWPKNISDTDLPWLYHEIFDPFEHNPSSYDHPKMEYEKAKWIIDAGCCEGYFSLFAAEKNHNCLLLALEPLAEMKEALRKTFEKQIEKQKFYLEEKALGKDCGTISFQFNSQHLCDSSINNSNISQKNQHHSYYEVEVTNLDAIMIKYNLKENGLIKMDIEGAEMDALIGGTELMRKYKPKLAIAVYHDYENALKCREIIVNANPEYTVEFRGMYGYFKPPRPYILFAW